MYGIETINKINNTGDNIKNNYAVMYRVYIGKNDGIEKRQIIADDIFSDIINSVLINRNIECYTLYNAVGMYQRESEKTAIIEIIASENIKSTEAAIIDSIKEFRLAFNQRSILYTKQYIFMDEITK